MKQLIYLSIFAATSVFALSSCDNGKYDVNPDNDLTGQGNPTLPPKTKPDVGEFIAKVGGDYKLFTDAYFVDSNGFRTIVGSYKVGDRINYAVIKLKKFDSARVYEFGVKEIEAEYAQINPADSTSLKQFSTENPIRTGSGKVDVQFSGVNPTTGDAFMFGTFFFTAFRELPTESTIEKVDITEGSFNVKKL